MATKPLNRLTKSELKARHRSASNKISKLNEALISEGKGRLTPNDIAEKAKAGTANKTEKAFDAAMEKQASIQNEAQKRWGSYGLTMLM